MARLGQEPSRTDVLRADAVASLLLSADQSVQLWASPDQSKIFFRNGIILPAEVDRAASTVAVTPASKSVMLSPAFIQL